MTRRLTKLDAALALGVSPSTINRMIRRNELTIEKERRGSQYKVWVLLDDDLAVAGGAGQPAMGQDDMAAPPEGASGQPVMAPNGIAGSPGSDAAPPQVDLHGKAAPPEGAADRPTAIPSCVPGLPDGTAVQPKAEPNGAAGQPALERDGIAGPPENAADHSAVEPNGVAGNAALDPAGTQFDQAALVELATLRERVKNSEQLAEYRGELLKESELRFHALLQELSSSQRTVDNLTKMLPAGKEEEGKKRRRWWRFCRKAE